MRSLIARKKHILNMKMEDGEVENKMRLVEILLIIASFLFGLVKIQNNISFILFIIFAILYYVLVSNWKKSYGKLEYIFPFTVAFHFQQL